MANRLRIKFHDTPAITITRIALHADRLVYFAVTNKRMKYEYGASRIVYIGTTKKGVNRIASSAAGQGEALLSDRGIKRLEFYTITCSARQAVQTWRKLERALLIRFREKFGKFQGVILTVSV
jgi:predicted GIY-YIG superfamily endonuclease